MSLRPSLSACVLYRLSRRFWNPTNSSVVNWESTVCPLPGPSGQWKLSCLNILKCIYHVLSTRSNLFLSVIGLCLRTTMGHWTESLVSRLSSNRRATRFPQMTWLSWYLSTEGKVYCGFWASPRQDKHFSHHSILIFVCAGLRRPANCRLFLGRWKSLSTTFQWSIQVCPLFRQYFPLFMFIHNCLPPPSLLHLYLAML